MRGIGVGSARVGVGVHVASVHVYHAYSSNPEISGEASDTCVSEMSGVRCAFQRFYESSPRVPDIRDCIETSDFRVITELVALHERATEMAANVSSVKSR